MKPTLTEQLKDVLLDYDVSPRRELIDAILAAVGASTLSPKQFDVLRLALSGMNDKQIAEELKICARTIEEHWREIRQRLGIMSRIQLGGAVTMRLLWKPTTPQKPKITYRSKASGHNRPKEEEKNL